MSNRALAIHLDDARVHRERLPCTLVEDRVFSDASLSAFGKVAYWGLCRHADAGGRCWPSFSTLAELTGMSKRRMQDAIGELLERGYVAVEQRKRPGTQSRTSNLYTVKRQYDYTPAALRGMAQRAIGHNLPEGMAQRAKEDSSNERSLKRRGE